MNNNLYFIYQPTLQFYLVRRCIVCGEAFGAGHNKLHSEKKGQCSKKMRFCEKMSRYKLNLSISIFISINLDIMVLWEMRPHIAEAGPPSR